LRWSSTQLFSGLDMSASKGGAAQSEPPSGSENEGSNARSWESPPHIGIEALVSLPAGELPLRSTRREGLAGAASAPSQIVVAQISPAREMAIIRMLKSASRQSRSAGHRLKRPAIQLRVEAVEATTF
jgi:hypothetical protein